jgi:hypothetical protein
MTDEMMRLQALLEKSSDADLLREMIGFTAQRLMELEVEGLTGAGHGERSADRRACVIALSGNGGSVGQAATARRLTKGSSRKARWFPASCSGRAGPLFSVIRLNLRLHPESPCAPTSHRSVARWDRMPVRRRELAEKPRLQRALRTQAPVERLDECVVDRLARPGEVENDAVVVAQRSSAFEMNSGPLSTWMRRSAPCTGEDCDFIGKLQPLE